MNIDYILNNSIVSVSNFLTLKCKYIKGPEVCNLFSDSSRGKRKVCVCVCVCVWRERRGGRQTLAVNELGERCIWVFLHPSIFAPICFFQIEGLKYSLRKYEEVLQWQELIKRDQREVKFNV